MLPHAFRLPARAALTHPQFFSTPFFSVRIAANGLPYNRYGFVISKKTAASAVIRNTTKRRLRSCIEKQLDEIRAGHDMLFVLKKDAVATATSVLCKEIAQVVQKAHLL